MEIERKFIYNGKFNLKNFKNEEIIENYLNISKFEERVRQKGDKFYHTIKSFGELEREEREQEISKEEFLNLSSHKIGMTINKTRYYLPLKESLVAEVDIYNKSLSGLKIVEVEFLSKADAENFNPPNWFGKELTKNSAYKNSSLALFGLPADFEK